MDDEDWRRLVRQVRNGDCTPFIGAGACADTLPTGGELSREWAARHAYPFRDDDNLARTMQYAAIRTHDAVDIKEQVAETLAAVAPPDFSLPGEPHGVLASLPLPLYLTTNYDDFMVRALKDAGRDVHPVVCPWYEGARADDIVFTRGYVASPTRPLIYHLHGSIHDPRSIVITEEDYLSFLGGLLEDAGANVRILPAAIRLALTTKPLLFIGYSLQDWTFRVLFHGLLRTIPDVHQRRHVSVQMLPTLRPGAGAVDRSRAEGYLTDYFNQRWNISVFWGTAREFCTELTDRLGGRP